MNENQIKEEKQASDIKADEPTTVENSELQQTEAQTERVNLEEGQSDESDPSEKLILGKFKTVDDLAKAYGELQKCQGKSSQELGSLRKEIASLNGYKDMMANLNEYQSSITPVIERDKELYNTPEYLQNPIFKEIYSEALMTFGDNLDTDRLIGLLEKYVENRIQSHDKAKAANNETQSILDSMTYSKNLKNILPSPKKSLDEMTDEEFKVSLRKLI